MWLNTSPHHQYLATSSSCRCTGPTLAKEQNNGKMMGHCFWDWVIKRLTSIMSPPTDHHSVSISLSFLKESGVLLCTAQWRWSWGMGNNWGLNLTAHVDLNLGSKKTKYWGAQSPVWKLHCSHKRGAEKEAPRWTTPEFLACWKRGVYFNYFELSFSFKYNVYFKYIRATPCLHLPHPSSSD